MKGRRRRLRKVGIVVAMRRARMERRRVVVGESFRMGEIGVGKDEGALFWIDGLRLWGGPMSWISGGRKYCEEDGGALVELYVCSVLLGSESQIVCVFRINR